MGLTMTEIIRTSDTTEDEVQDWLGLGFNGERAHCAFIERRAAHEVAAMYSVFPHIVSIRWIALRLATLARREKPLENTIVTIGT
jgi:hypothetical protein